MIRIILLSHESIADAMKSAAESICGPQTALDAYGIKAETDLEGLVEELTSDVDEMSSPNGGILIMTDLLGGSTTQLAVRASTNDNAWVSTDGKVRVVTGLNLPMLIGVIGKRHDIELGQLAEFAMTCGREGIVDVAALLETKTARVQEADRRILWECTSE